jgi:hypothetical protein
VCVVFANITKNLATKFSKICVGGGAEKITSSFSRRLVFSGGGHTPPPLATALISNAKITKETFSPVFPAVPSTTVPPGSNNPTVKTFYIRKNYTAITEVC